MMYERFTDRARQAMQFANVEAARLNHDYVGPEHILFGLAKEASGVAHHVLLEFHLDSKEIRTSLSEAGQDDRTVGARLPILPGAKQAVLYAIEEARGMNHNYVGTEHILLGILRGMEESGTVAAIFTKSGVDSAAVRAKVLELLGQ